MNNDYNVILVNGDDLFLSVTIQTRDGDIVDLTDYTFNFGVKEQYKDEEFVFEVAGVVANPATGVVEFTKETKTLELEIWNYVYDIEAIDPNNKRITLLRGFFTIKNNVN